MQKLVEIGAAWWLPGTGEFEVCGPERIVDLYKARWDRKARHLGWAGADDVTVAVDSGLAVWGGCTAARAHLGRHVAGFDETTAYVTNPAAICLRSEDSGQDVRVFEWGGPLSLPAGDCATPVQVIAELFATPGWQADEFYRAMYFSLIMPIQGDVSVI